MRREYKLLKDKKNAEKYTYILNGSVRKSIFLCISKDPKSASEIQRETMFPLSSICRALKDLKEKKIIICINNQQYKGKMYFIPEENEFLSELVKKKLI